MAAKKPYQTGWVLRDAAGEGFVVDDPIEGDMMSPLLSHADVWETREAAEQAGKDRKYVLVVPVQVRLEPNRARATAMDFVVER